MMRTPPSSGRRRRATNRAPRRTTRRRPNLLQRAVTRRNNWVETRVGYKNPKRTLNVSKSMEMGETTTSRNKITYKRPKGLKGLTAIGGLGTFQTVRTWGLSGGQSKQAITGYAAQPVIPSILDGPEIKDIYKRLAKNSIDIGGINTGVTDTMDEQGLGFLGGKKLYIKSVQHETRFSNHGASNCEVDFYMLMSKNSEQTALDPVTLWDEGVTTTQGSAAVGGSTNNPDFPYQKPTISKNFNMKFKIVHKQRIFMCPGADHVHNFSFNVNRVIDSSYPADYDTIKGITFIPFAVCRGTLGSSFDSTDPDVSISLGNIGTTKSKIIGTVRQSVKAQIMNFWPKMTYTNHNLSDVTDGQLWVHNKILQGPVNGNSAVNFT